MRLPIRARLTAWYAMLLALIVVVLGAYLVLELESDLTNAIDREIRDNTRQIAAGYVGEGVEDFHDVSGTVLPPDGAVSQITTPDGRVIASDGIVDREEDVGSSARDERLGAARPIADEAMRADALAGRAPLRPIVLGRDRQEFRALAMAVRRGGRARIVVVAESLERVESSVSSLLVLLLVAGPVALGATALGGWWLARKALLPVARMSREASAIGIDRLHDRVAVPSPSDEVHDLAVTLNAMLERLEQGVAEKHRLIADASHELRTPLAIMRAELDVALADEALPPTAREVLASERDEVDRMSRLVENLLTLAQVDEGRLELLRADVDLAGAIDAAVRPLRPVADAAGVRLEVDPGSAAAWADPHRLDQLLTNLIENAIKYSPSGGTVLVSGWEREGVAGVSVADDGPGIPPEARERLFDRFYRIDSARAREAGGSGLGLAICREIAEAHGGRVWLESEEGRGSTFSVALPRPSGVSEPAPRALA